VGPLQAVTGTLYGSSDRPNENARYRAGVFAFRGKIRLALLTLASRQSQTCEAETQQAEARGFGDR